MNSRDTRACFLMAQAGAAQMKTYAEKLLHESAVSSDDITHALAYLDEAVSVLSECRELYEDDPPRGEHIIEWTHDG